jgi:hypothetical protein
MSFEELNNEVIISIWPSEAEEGHAFNVSIGWDFDESVSEEECDYYRKIAAGIYGLLSARIDDVLAVGDIVEATSDFGTAMDNDDDEMELVFTPDDELIDQISDSNEPEPEKKIVDLRTYKFNPKKHKKH